MITIKHKKYGDITFDDGTPSQDIVNYLVEVDALGGEQYGTLETLGTQAGRSMSSSVRQLKEWGGLGNVLSEHADQIAEYESRIMMEQNPVASVTGMLAGSVLDPVTLPALALKPLTFASKVATLASRGAAQGAVGGALEPIYDQYGDSTVLNIMAGTAIGGGLGAGIGKLLTKSVVKSEAESKDANDSLQESKAANDSLQESSEKTLTNLASSIDESPVRTRQQALDKIQKEMELEAAGAPSKLEMDDVKLRLNTAQRKVDSLESQGQRLQLGAKGKNKQQVQRATGKNKAQLGQAKKELQELQIKSDDGSLRGKAAERLQLLKESKYSQIEGLDVRLKAATPIRRNPLSEAVNQATPQRVQINPFNANTSRILGVADESPPVNIKNNTYGVGDAVEGLPEPRAGGSSGVSFGDRVGAALLPRTADNPEVTAGVIAGKFTGKNAKTRINIKESRANKEARETVQRKLDRGEEPTTKELDNADEATFSAQALEEYKLFVQKIAGSRSLDTAALQGYLKGRYTFKGIEGEAAALLKKNGIEDFEDMVNYILDDSKRIFSAAEMEMLSPLFGLAEKKLYNAMEMIKHTDGMTDDMIAVLHSEINLYYGIQAWNKSQGSKVSAALNHRNKMLKDIAEDRQIDSLWAGVKCK